MKKRLNETIVIKLLNLISIILTGFTVFMFIQVIFNANKLFESNNERYFLAQNAYRFMNGSSYLTQELKSYVITQDEKHYDNFWDEVNNLHNRDIAIENIKKSNITPQESLIADDMFSLSNSLIEIENNAMNNVKNGNVEYAKRLVFGNTYTESIEHIQQLQTEFIKNIEKRMEIESKKLKRVTAIYEILTIIFLFLLIVFSIISAIIIKTKVLLPIIKQKNEFSEKAKKDQLTRVYNKATTEYLIKEILNRRRFIDDMCALIIIDIDNFKKINDSFGHFFGDVTLTQIAEKMIPIVRSEDIIGRIGGDEFFIFMNHLKSREILHEKAQKICEVVNQTITQKNKSVLISASIGIAICPDNGTDFETLYKNADDALYRAKKAGKNTYQFYDDLK